MESNAKQEPVAWKHDCAALLTNDVELWIDACPHCGKPRPAPQPKPAEQEPQLTVDALRVEFEKRHRGTIGTTRIASGEYLSPAIETEWQQFVRKYTAPQPAKREPLTVDILPALKGGVSAPEI